MVLYLSMIARFLVGFLQEGGGESETVAIYQLAGLTWWGALLLVSLVILAAWTLITWQAAHFDRRMASESSGEHGHAGEGGQE